MTNEDYLRRCFQLARLGEGKTFPNPLVGAVIVHKDRIIGEGFHEKPGSPHAEVNAIRDAINKGNERLLPESVLFVNLEPCNHHGRTPPCTDAIISNSIPSVVCSNADVIYRDDGSGFTRLKSCGVNVISGVLEADGRKLNRRFFTFHEKKRPYIVLKFAQSSDGFIASSVQTRQTRHFTTHETDVLVHRWRSHEHAIMVGTNTALADNPKLTVRHWPGKNPVRILIDGSLKVPLSYNIYNDDARVLVFNSIREGSAGHITYIRRGTDVQQIMSTLYEMEILSVFVEGGSRLHQSLIDAALWDEIRTITSPEKFTGGLPAPSFKAHCVEESMSTGEVVRLYLP